MSLLLTFAVVSNQLVAFIALTLVTSVGVFAMRVRSAGVAVIQVPLAFVDVDALRRSVLVQVCRVVFPTRLNNLPVQKDHATEL